MRRIGYDSWGVLVIVAAVLVVTLTADYPVHAPRSAPVDANTSWPNDLVAAIKSSPGLATFVGAIMGSSIGLLAILVGAMFNAYLNRRQHDRERDEDRQALAAAYYGEIKLLVTALETPVPIAKAVKEIYQHTAIPITSNLNRSLFLTGLFS